MKSKPLLFATGFLLCALLLSAGSVVFAQTSEDVERRRAELQRELNGIEKEIQEQQSILNVKRSERQSLERDVEILNAEIRKAQLEIRARNLAISEISGEIGQREDTIQELDAKISREKDSLARLIRRRNEIDSISLVEMALGQDTISDFFEDLDTFDSLKLSLQASLNEIRRVQESTELEKQQLAVQQREETDARVVVEEEKRTIEQKEVEKQRLVDAKRTEEQTYEQIVAAKQQRANQIRAALFQLSGTGAIPFGEALDFANAASEMTGVRPEFILGILKQESNIGQNVGTCNRPGDPPSKNWQNIMKPDRDHAPYLRITSELGLDPNSMPLSCPQPGGYGGAMGPSQFIPSTWELYKAKIAGAVGVSVPNPWEPRHAFMATAIFLRDLGAGRGGYSAEREAAARYYAGGNWQSRGLGYADNVLYHAQVIKETMIDPLQDL